MCILSEHTLLNVVGYYDLSVPSMSVMGLQKKLDVGGWGELYPFFGGFLEFFKLCKTLNRLAPGRPLSAGKNTSYFPSRPRSAGSRQFEVGSLKYFS